MTAVAERSEPAGRVTGADLIITEPGIYDMPEDAYHADPVPGGSLSSTEARMLLPPSCPAKLAWRKAHPEPPSAEMDLGTAAHKLVLGTGRPIRVIAADDKKLKATRQAIEDARAEGFLPLLTKEHATVQAMAAAIRADPQAGRLFDPWRGGEAEQSAFAPDPETRVWCRARFDWLAGPVAVDYKTTGKSANPAQFGRTAADFGYHVQQEFYRRVYAALTGTWPEFAFVVQETSPPYLVGVCRLDDSAAYAGGLLVTRALEIYRDCTESGNWPGYNPDAGPDDEIPAVSLPLWAIRRAEET